MLAAFSPPDAARADALLDAVVADLTAAGVPAAGCVQRTVTLASGRDTKWLAFLDGGPPLAITVDLGSGAAGCSLDPAALALAAARIAPQIAGARVLILNRFGRTEAMGGGFRPLIADALAAEVPVLTVVPARYRGAFDDFAGEFACWLAPDPAALRHWLAAQGIAVAGGIRA